jgi:hypothetical protein
MAAHALLSASGASRWLACTPSARLEETYPDNAGEAAKEGTLAHEYGETIILRSLDRITQSQYDAIVSGIKAHPLYFEGMDEYCQDYASYVLGELEEYRRKTPDTLIDIEVKLQFDEWVPGGFGTGDTVIITDKRLRIIDLKFGKGVPVDCRENKQMMLYALGALWIYKWIYSIDVVEMTIYQPRLENISSWEIGAQQLENWAEGFLKPRAQMAHNGEGDFAPGDHCRFCKAKHRCRALAEEAQKAEELYPATPESLGDKEIADILKKASLYVTWVNSITDYAQDQAVNHGKQWPGFKLVEGRSNRTYTDEDRVASTLLNNGFERFHIFTEKLLGITAMEKAITKKKFDALLSQLVIKPEGKPTLVPLDDKRPALNTAARAAQAFADVDLTAHQ